MFFNLVIMTILMREAGRISRLLSWNTPVKTYYSVAGRVPCPACKIEVNLRDLIERKGAISCKKCK